MASSRIFVSGLPPTMSETDFRKHFSAKALVTDVRLLQSRRIGFVGFRNSEEAAKAVKYFNRSYIRMSKIRVELATPVKPLMSEPAPLAESHNEKGNRDARLPATLDTVKEKAMADDRSKKRKRQEVDEADPKLQEFLEVMHPGQAMKRARDADDPSKMQGGPESSVVVMDAGHASDDEYETMPKSRRPTSAGETAAVAAPDAIETQGGLIGDRDEIPGDEATEAVHDAEDTIEASVPDDEWLRRRKSRLLDLVDADDLSLAVKGRLANQETGGQAQRKTDDAADIPEDPVIEDQEESNGPGQQQQQQPPGAIELIQKTSRLFLRNLSYETTEDDIRDRLEKFGSVKEVHLNRGYAFVHFEDPSSAVSAFQNLDGTIFGGRILHVLPASEKRQQKLDDFALSNMPLKKRQLLKKKGEAASNSFQWNSLWMNPDAIVASTADRLGVSKADLLDPTSTDAAVKQAVAETAIIQETKAYFAANGVSLDAFKSHKRGDTTILVKNFPYGTTIAELRKLFEEHGTVLKVLMPPSGTIAIVQYTEAAHAKAAFGRLAYRRLKDSVLFLEKGPGDLFTGREPVQANVDPATGIQKPSVADLLERNDDLESPATTTLFMRNLNFATTTEKLAATLRPLEGFVSARVKYRPDPKKPGQLLSMGYGFADFRTKEAADAALRVMDGYVLDGHTLAVKPSQKGLDAGEERRREDKAKRLAAQKTKLVIRNVPFEVTKKEIRSLFGTYGELRAIRMPKKFGNRSRGFAFAEFATAREAENCYDALRDTHLLGRRLVLEWAEAEAVDAEEEIAKMQKKIGGQFNKMSLQQLTGAGRQKVNIGDNEDEDEE